jgi:hypothetical protein
MEIRMPLLAVNNPIAIGRRRGFGDPVRPDLFIHTLAGFDAVAVCEFSAYRITFLEYETL